MAVRTKDKILLTSLRLFNEKGERSVTTNHIAAALEMSPGNLYYHFRNKGEIIHQLFQQFENKVGGYMAKASGDFSTYSYRIKHLEGMLKITWAYRFLQRDVIQMLQENDDLKLTYRQFTIKTLKASKFIEQTLVKNGLLQMDEEQLNALVLNIWMILSWCPILPSISVRGTEKDVGKGFLMRAIYQIVCLEEPYASPDVKAQLPFIKKKYLNENAHDLIAGLLIDH